MKFYESGLPNDKLVEEAFNASYANAMTFRADVMKDFVRQIGLSFQQQIGLLEADKTANLVSEDEYKREKAALERMRDEQLKMGPRVVEDELNKMFVQRRLAPAQELQKNSEKVSPEALAAAMLIECVRSPIDYMNLVKKFGDEVGRLVAEVHHADAYPSDRDDALAKSDSETKRVYLALLVTSLDSIVAQAQLMAKINPAQKVVFYGGQEETLFGNAKALWGNDKKLDQRFLAAFNSAAEITTSAFRLEVDASGALELVIGSVTPKDPKNKPPGPKGKSGLGDNDIF